MMELFWIKGGIRWIFLIWLLELLKYIQNSQESFLLEPGYGFCFEARQKQIQITDEYFFIDLFFYHLVLKCHVLIELKT
jgi:predicted nuclease of restriction endonuclease-like (RecB) superfamily